MSELDAANAAPPASDTERKSALGWIAVIAVLGLIALIVAGVYSYKSHKAEVAKIEAAPEAGIPASENPTITRKKVATKKIAPQAVNTPTPSVPEVVQFQTEQPPAVEVKQPLSARELAYEKRLNEFDNRLTKGEKP